MVPASGEGCLVFQSDSIPRTGTIKLDPPGSGIFIPNTAGIRISVPGYLIIPCLFKKDEKHKPLNSFVVRRTAFTLRATMMLFLLRLPSITWLSSPLDLLKRLF